ncbi:MAG TPA: ABC transporter substrate-binding protein [Alphaproteobacteria bacterium]|nr:ABC transporter substrate-binding protein [Alphaproteobacteria bacterium]
MFFNLIRTRYRGTLAITCILLAFSTYVGQVRAATETPKQVVEAYYATLLDTMRNGPKLGYKGRYDRLATAVDKAFNVTVMAQQSVGTFWDQMTEAQRTELVAAFRKFTIANYAHSFDDYAGEQFLTAEEKETPRKDVIVYTTLVKSDGDKVTLNYLLRQDGGDFKIIDIFLDGSISQLATRRSEYTSIIRQSGIDALIAAIEKKAADLAN